MSGHPLPRAIPQIELARSLEPASVPQKARDHGHAATQGKAKTQQNQDGQNSPSVTQAGQLSRPRSRIEEGRRNDRLARAGKGPQDPGVEYPTGKERRTAASLNGWTTYPRRWITANTRACQGMSVSKERGQRFAGCLQAAPGPPELLVRKRLERGRKFRRDDPIRSIADAPSPPLNSIAEVEVFGQGVGLPTPGLLAPHASGAVEIETPAATRTSGLFDHKVPIDPQGLGRPQPPSGPPCLPL